MPGTLSRKRAGAFQRISRAARAAVRAFADPEPLARATLLAELGVPGDSLESGLPVDPYNPELDGPDWFAKVDEMRRCGAQGTAIELCITLPIVSTEWYVEGESEELKLLAETMLFEAEGMSTTWTDVVRRAALSALYGTWCFEKVWKEQDGALMWRRLADRLPRSITGYLWADDGGLAGVTQKGTRPGGDEEIEVELPIEKILLFPYRQEGSNWNGLSILRGAYLHWFVLQMLYRIANIGIERDMRGTYAGYLPQNYKEADKTTFLALLRGMRRHESGGVVLPPGWKIEDLGGAGGRIEWMAYLEHHRNEMFRAGLLDWLVLGDTASGSRALADPKIQFALMSWDSLADGIATTTTRHGLRQVIAYNAPTASGADIPRLRAAPIWQRMRMQEASEFILGLVQQRLIVPDDEAELENFFRTGLGIPERDPRQQGAPAPTPPQAAPQAEMAPATPPPGQEAAVRTFAEADVRAAVALVQRDMDAAEDGWQRRGREHLAAWLTALLEQVDQAATETDLAGIAVPLAQVAGYSEWIAEWLDAVYDQAARRMEEELGRRAAPADDPTARHRARAVLLAEHHAEAARFAVLTAALAGESAAQIATRFAEQMDIRLRHELTDEARGIAGAVSADG